MSSKGGRPRTSAPAPSVRAIVASASTTLLYWRAPRCEASMRVLAVVMGHMTTTEAPRAVAPTTASLIVSGVLRVRRKRSDPNWIAPPPPTRSAAADVPRHKLWAPPSCAISRTALTAVLGRSAAAQACNLVLTTSNGCSVTATSAPAVAPATAAVAPMMSVGWPVLQQQKVLQRWASYTIAKRIAQPCTAVHRYRNVLKRCPQSIVQSPHR